MRPLLLFVFLIATTAPVLSQEVSTFENRWKPAERLAVEDGALVSDPSASTAWVIEPVDGTYVRLRNLATGLYLHNETGLSVGPIEPGWWSAMWELEPISGDRVRIKNRWLGTYLHNENGPLELGEIQSGWNSAMWSQQPVQTQLAFSKSTTAVESRLGMFHVPTEYGISGGISSHLGTHIQGMAAVGIYWVLSHDNGGNRDGDLIIIDPAIRERVKSHTIRFSGDDGYMAAAQGNGSYLAVATGLNKAIRVFSISDGADVSELTNLTLNDPFGNGSRVENVGFAYHPVHRRHYLLVVNNSTNKLFVSSGSALESSTWSLVSASSGSGTVPYGEAGISLLYDETAGLFYVLSLGQDGSDSDAENSFSVWKLNPTDVASGTNAWREFTASAATPEHRRLTDGAGSFRWGGTAHVLANGGVQILAAPRDFKLIGDSDFGVWTSGQPMETVRAPAPAVPTIRVRVTSVKCVETTEWGEDEVYLTVDGTRYPAGNESYHDINDGESWSVGASATSTSAVTLTLLEYDTTDDRDLIGTITVPIQKIHGTYTDTLRGDDGVYEVTYQVSR